MHQLLSLGAKVALELGASRPEVDLPPGRERSSASVASFQDVKGCILLGRCFAWAQQDRGREGERERGRWRGREGEREMEEVRLHPRICSLLHMSEAKQCSWESLSRRCAFCSRNFSACRACSPCSSLFSQCHASKTDGHQLHRLRGEKSCYFPPFLSNHSAALQVTMDRNEMVPY
jgi:hypothetical protein